MITAGHVYINNTTTAVLWIVTGVLLLAAWLIALFGIRK